LAHDVFISYSREDKLAADAACANLEAAGIRCWIAPRDISPGAEWGEAIVEAIDHSPVMVLIFSANANESRQIRREVERAVHMGVTVVPLRIEQVEPKRSLAYFMAGVHWLDALTPPLEQHLQQLAVSIKAFLRAAPADAPSGPEQTRPDPAPAAIRESPAATTPEPVSRKGAEDEQQRQAPAEMTPAPAGGADLGRGARRLLRQAAAIFAIVAISLVMVAAWMFVSRPDSRPQTPPPAPPSTAAPSTVPTPPPAVSPTAVEVPAAEALEKGDEASGRKDYGEAMRWYRKAADQGNAQAYGNIGRFYLLGQGVSVDYGAAMLWSRKAADQGNPRGQTVIGVLYRNGWGVGQDSAEAMRWFRKAADQGYAAAQTNIGVLYENGWGVIKDYAEAMRWYRKAADQGYAAAQNNIGLLYRNGRGVAQDYAEAVR
jgi:tetratricopeptide (TPR) repeat protein